MTIAPDPNSDTSADSEDTFERDFQEFAARRNGTAPHSEAPREEVQPEGNDPEGAEPAPAQAATEAEAPKEEVTSGDAGTEGGTQPPPVEQAPDPLANLTPEARAIVEQLQRERDEARHRAQSDANRVAALSRKLQSFQTQPPASAPAPAEEKSEAQKALDDKIKQLRADYGDIADPLIELIENQSRELNSVRTVLTGLSEERQAQVIAAEEQALAERHPDWREVARSEQFAGWLENQPENIRRMASESWDARETSVVLTLFKAERAEGSGQQEQATPAPTPEPAPKAEAATGARRSQQLDGGRDVRSRPAPAASGPPEDFEAAFAYFQAKRQQAAAARR